MNAHYPVEVMEAALNLRNSLKRIYLALFKIGKPATSEEVAGKVGQARAYVNMRLQQLCDLGLVREVEHEGKEKYFEVKAVTKEVD